MIRKISPMDNRLAVLIAMDKELKEAKPNALVLQVCELFLAVTWQEMRHQVYIDMVRGGNA